MCITNLFLRPNSPICKKLLLLYIRYTLLTNYANERKKGGNIYPFSVTSYIQIRCFETKEGK